jgi:hypothetical protein
MIFQRRYRLLEGQKKLMPINRPIIFYFFCNNDNYNNTELTLILTSIKSIYPNKISLMLASNLPWLTAVSLWSATRERQVVIALD